MQISPETQLFIREHQTDDVRALALQARKYPNVDMPTAIPKAPVTGAMLVRSHRQLQSNPFKR